MTEFKIGDKVLYGDYEDQTEKVGDIFLCNGEEVEVVGHVGIPCSNYNMIYVRNSKNVVSWQYKVDLKKIDEPKPLEAGQEVWVKAIVQDAFSDHDGEIKAQITCLDNKKYHAYFPIKSIHIKNEKGEIAPYLEND